MTISQYCTAALVATVCLATAALAYVKNGIAFLFSASGFTGLLFVIAPFLLLWIAALLAKGEKISRGALALMIFFLLLEISMFYLGVLNPAASTASIGFAVIVIFESIISCLILVGAFLSRTQRGSHVSNNIT